MTIFPSPPSPHPLPPLGLSVTETVLETNLNSLFVPLSTYPVIGSHLLLFRKDWVSVGGPPSVLCILEDVCAPASCAPAPSSSSWQLGKGFMTIAREGKTSLRRFFSSMSVLLPTVLIEAKKGKVLNQNQRQLLVGHYKDNFGEKAKRHLEIGEAFLLQ